MMILLEGWHPGWQAGIAWFALAAAGTLASIPWLIRQARRRSITAPVEGRSNHRSPVPVGGGWGIVVTTILLWPIAMTAAREWSSFHLVLLLGGAALAVMSWQDDRRGVGWGWRLIGQAAAVGAGMATLPLEALPGIDLLAAAGWDRHGPLAIVPLFAVALLWLWFINLFNFMDGIDGITAVEGSCVALGLAGIFFLLDAPGAFALASILAGACVGFGRWNWQPAKIFCGDVGSIPLGYWIGGLLILAGGGHLAGGWQAALILPLYYLADGSITLGKRLWGRQKVWRAHSSHYYQRAVRGGLSHAAVCRSILLTNGVLLALAATALTRPAYALAALAAAGTSVGALLVRFAVAGR